MSAPAFPETPAVDPTPTVASRRATRRSSLLAHGEPSVWLSGGALAVALFMIVGLLLLVLIQGSVTFWPAELVQVRTVDGTVFLGEVTKTDSSHRPEAHVFAALPEAAREEAKAEVEEAGGLARRRLLRTGNFDLTGKHHNWVSDFQIIEETHPEWALVIERSSNWGRFYGTPASFEVSGVVVATEPADVWVKFNEYHGEVRGRLARRTHLERHDMGAVSAKENAARLAVREAELRAKNDTPELAVPCCVGSSGKGKTIEEAQAEYTEVIAWAKKEQDRIKTEINALNKENDRYHMTLVTADGVKKTLPLAEIVRAYPANQLTFWDKVGVYFSRWGEYLSDGPRAANTEGGVFPAICGTVSMTLLMCLAVVPFGVLAALYLREYAKSGPIVSAIRIAINNLAGVPSIVFGVFGLGFFCYLVGGFIDGGPKKIDVHPWPPAQWWLTFAAAVVIGLFAFAIGIGAIRNTDKTSWTATLLGRGSLALWLVTVVVVVLLLVKVPFFSGLYEAKLPSPTFGTGGMMWAALTLALLTLPVVIVATEEALSAVPNSMREGSYACGASKWQTIRRIVLPRAMPGIMTGMILAMARGAGEVAPIMLVGAVKYVAELPVDGDFPWVHPSRAFMHLGFHIYDVGFQSPNSEAARPMVYTTTLLLIMIVALLNLMAVWLRSRLRKRFKVNEF